MVVHRPKRRRGATPAQHRRRAQRRAALAGRLAFVNVCANGLAPTDVDLDDEACVSSTLVREGVSGNTLTRLLGAIIERTRELRELKVYQ